MRFAIDYARVRVPATSGNLGPGFDSMGMAHDIWDDVSATITTGPTKITILGEGKDTLARDESHLVIRAMHRTMERVGVSQAGIELVARNAIEHGKGLGSSAAAVVAGILLVRELIDHPEVLDEAAMLDIAAEFEGHPDNAAPAIYGGATVSWKQGESYRTARLPVSDAVHTTLLIPAEVLPTSQARAALPMQVPLADASFNAGRTALLAHALAHAPQFLFEATEDRLHQGYRASAMRHTADLLAALRNAGWPAVVSGAGPTILVFAQVDSQTRRVIEGQGFKVVPSKQVRGAHAVTSAQ
ncbi:MAG: homoserine kinase [Actinomycetaceae bacterium]|nr:homoserine kinase [Actinomycetaceae bacterium]